MRKGNTPLPGDIHKRLRHAGDMLTKHPAIVFAYLFGGFGRGEIEPLSDVDIAIYLAENTPNMAVKLELIGLMTGILGTDEMDVVLLNDAPLSLAGRIQQSARLIVDKDPRRRHAYESLIRREFADFQIRERALLHRRFNLG
jgi:hypothetical protein